MGCSKSKQTSESDELYSNWYTRTRKQKHGYWHPYLVYTDRYGRIYYSRPKPRVHKRRHKVYTKHKGSSTFYDDGYDYAYVDGTGWSHSEQGEQQNVMNNSPENGEDDQTTGLTSSAGVNPADDAGPNEGPPPDAGATNNANKPPEEQNNNKNLKPPEDTGGDNIQDHQAQHHDASHQNHQAQHHDASHQNVVSGGGIETANNQTVTSGDAGGGGASGDTGGGGGVSHD